MNIKFPRYIMVQTTSYCNADCIICPYGSLSKKQPQGLIDPKTYNKIIDEASNYDVERILLYLMNEPLMDKDIVNKINYAKEKNTKAIIHIVSNGSLLNKKLSMYLINSKLDYIEFSVLANRKETYRKVMHLDFDKTIKGILDFIKIARIQNKSNDYININITRTPSFLSYEEKDETINFWRNVGIKNINYFDRPISRAGNVSSLPKIKHDSICGCNSIWTNEMMHILYNGDVILCCMDWKRKVILGNVKKESIYQIWNGEKYKKVRRMIKGEIESPPNFICKRCDAALRGEFSKVSKIVSKTNTIDIVLVTLPSWGIESPPVGLGYLAEYLVSKGVNVEVLDFNIEFFNKFKEEYSYLWEINNQKYWFDKILFKKLIKIFKEEIDRGVNKIISSNAKIIAFSVPNPKERITIETIKKLKEKRPKIKIILGGASCNFDGCRSIFIKNIPDLVDAYVIGEGEETLLELIQAIKNSEELKKIKGVITYKDGKYSKLIKREPLDYKTINIFPTYSKFDLSKYTNHNMVTVEWSRGCVGNCSFCQHKTIWGNHRSRTAENIVSEIKYHVRKNNIKYFSVCDSTINSDLKQLEEICELIIESKLNIRWSGLAIPREMGYSLLKKMKKAGCYRLEYGVETGSNHVLKLMRKIHNVEDAEKTLRLTHKAGINVVLFIIVGFPEETDEDFNKTLEFIRRNKDYIDLVRSVNGLYIMEGTDIGNNPEKYGIIMPDYDWTGYHWYTNDGNNAEERSRKVRKIILLLNELGIKHELDTVFETGKTKNLDEKGINSLNKRKGYDKEKVLSKSKEEERKRTNVSYKKDKSIVHILKEFLNIRNLFRNNDNINKTEQIRKKLIPIPKYVTIDLTNSCNLNCIGCWTHSQLLNDKEASEEWKSQMIPFNTLKKLIDDLHELGTRRVRLTGGGEPFLYPKIMEIIRLIKEKGMACDITTNFMLLTKEKIKGLFELNIDELVVSIWAGDAKTYVKTHPNQTKRTFERIRDNLKFIAQYKEKVRKGPKVIMANVISKINYNKVEEMAKFATHVSLDELYFTLVDPIKNRTDCLLLNNKERKNLLKKLKNVKKIVEAYNKKSKIHKIRIDDIDRFIGKVKSKKANTGKYDLSVLNKPCYIGYIFSRVLANGDVVPCCRAVMYPTGNINKKSFKEIWFSKEYNKFRERALYESKLSPYFKRIGCYMTCDNQVHNREIETISL